MSCFRVDAVRRIVDWLMACVSRSTALHAFDRVDRSPVSRGSPAVLLLGWLG